MGLSVPQVDKWFGNYRSRNKSHLMDSEGLIKMFKRESPSCEEYLTGEALERRTIIEFNKPIQLHVKKNRQAHF